MVPEKQGSTWDKNTRLTNEEKKRYRSKNEIQIQNDRRIQDLERTLNKFEQEIKKFINT